jgi:uncharacterized membrane protein YeaQ/YmgE (transglycosylase-associated protein family)
MNQNTAVSVLALVGAVVVGLILLDVARDLFGVLVRLLVWMLSGMLAGRLLRGRGYGPMYDTLLGLVGGIVGSICLSLAGLGGLSHIPLVGSLIVGVIGAIIFVYLVRLFKDAQFAG